MKTRIWLAALLIAAGAFGSHHTSPVLKAARDTGQDASTLDDQVDLAVTVYNSDIALVRDVRDKGCDAIRAKVSFRGFKSVRFQVDEHDARALGEKPTR